MWLCILLWLVITAPAPHRDWQAVDSFGYQLQNVRVRAVQESDYDLMVIDYSVDGSAKGAFHKGDVQKMQRKADGCRRLLLAYLSLGEAEDYRYYWRAGQTPSWLERENPDWPGNYKVRFWHEDWQCIVLDYAHKLAELGYDGIYLDLVDAYQYWEDQGQDDARQRMVALVHRVAASARSRAGADFGIFAQNADELAADLPVLTGVGREGVYFGLEQDNRATPPENTRIFESQLDRLVRKGKLVLLIDYTNRPEQIASARERASRRGYLSLAAPRQLDRL